MKKEEIRGRPKNKIFKNKTMKFKHKVFCLERIVCSSPLIIICGIFVIVEGEE
jgi:hypothetical protein